MAQLAIKGHPTRGKEVIALLEMLGGENKYQVAAIRKTFIYFVDGDTITLLQINQLRPTQFIIFTLEEFEEKFLYKVGDKVNAPCKGCVKTITSMKWDTYSNTVIYKLNNREYTNIDQLKVVNDLQPYKEETMKEELIPRIDFNKYCKDKYLLDLSNYEIKEENGKTYAVRKQSQYPKTYEECCEILGLDNDNFLSIRNYFFDDGKEPITNYERALLDRFSYLWELLICRNAYWKVAGKQMGLGKPWKYDMTKNEFVYAIAYQYEHIRACEIRYRNCLLIFPTTEMRSAFYENFKDLIEKCKELL